MEIFRIIADVRDPFFPDAFEVRFPLFGWWLPFLLLGIAAMVWLFRARKWRLFPFVSIIALAAIPFILLLRHDSYDRAYLFGVNKFFPKPDGTGEVWQVHFDSSCGGILFKFEIARDAEPTAPTGRPTFIRFARGPRGSNGKNYPVYSRRFSIIDSDFLEKTLGFQVCWSTPPIEPGRFSKILLFSVTVPHGFLILLCLTFPLLWLRRHLRQRYRRLHNLCLTCGYDLRASPDRCPECGAPVVSARLAEAGAQ